MGYAGQVFRQIRVSPPFRSIFCDSGSNRTAESTSPPKRDSGGVKRSGSRKKVVVNHGSKVIKKPEKTGCRSKASTPPRKINIKIPDFSTAASTGGTPTSASSAHDTPVIEMHDYGVRTVPRCSRTGLDSTSIL